MRDVLLRLAHGWIMLNPCPLLLRLLTSTASYHAPGAGFLARCEAKKGKELKTQALHELQDALLRLTHGRTKLNPRLLLLRLLTSTASHCQRKFYFDFLHWAWTAEPDRGSHAESLASAAAGSGYAKAAKLIFKPTAVYSMDVSEVVQKGANRFAGITIVERYSSL
jgi:hypothetical protein